MSEIFNIEWLESHMKELQKQRHSFLCEHSTCYGLIQMYIVSDGRYIVKIDNSEYVSLVTESAEEARDCYCKFVDDANNYADKLQNAAD